MGKLRIASTAPDGWISDQTWTYATATTFTVPGDQTEKFSKGTRIKLTQTTVKYFVVVGSSFAGGTTTVTVTGGSDYSLANAAITQNYYSYASNPQGYPGWFNWSPTYAGFSTNPASAVARFAVDGRICTIHWNHGTQGTSNATTFTMTLPVAAIRATNWVGTRTVDNGAFQAADGLAEIQIGNLSLLVLTRDGASLAWTASGGKSVFIDGFAYEI